LAGALARLRRYRVRAGLSVQADFKVRLLIALAATETWDGRHDRALALLEEARALDQDLDDKARAALLFSLANGYGEAGDLTRAQATAEEARDILTRLRDRRLLAHVAETQAQIALAQANEPMVVTYANEALDLARATGNTHAESSALLTLARLHRQHDRPADAESSYRAAIDVLRQHGPRRQLSTAFRELADLLLSQERNKEAAAILQEAISLTRGD
jgi:tetratricopeptide (TPR) repeat protein